MFVVRAICEGSTMCKRVREHDESQQEEMSFWNGNHSIDFLSGGFRHNDSLSLGGIAFPEAQRLWMQWEIIWKWIYPCWFHCFYKAAWVINIILFM